MTNNNNKQSIFANLAQEDLNHSFWNRILKEDANKVSDQLRHEDFSIGIDISNFDQDPPWVTVREEEIKRKMSRFEKLCMNLQIAEQLIFKPSRIKNKGKQNGKRRR